MSGFNIHDKLGEGAQVGSGIIKNPKSGVALPWNGADFVTLFFTVSSGNITLPTMPVGFVVKAVATGSGAAVLKNAAGDTIATVYSSASLLLMSLGNGTWHYTEFASTGAHATAANVLVSDVGELLDASNVEAALAEIIGLLE